jgi:hypothetical protein
LACKFGHGENVSAAEFDKPVAQAPKDSPMSFVKTAFTSAALLAGGLSAMTPENADARVSVQIGGGGYGYGNGYGFNGGYGSGFHNHGYGGSGFRSYNYGGYGPRYSGGWNGGFGGWNGGGPYDYHPTTVVPHRGHLDVQPGHYDYEPGGYWR